MCAQSLSRVPLFATPWTVACQAPLSMGFSRQEHWNGLPFPFPGDLPNPRIEPKSPVAPELTGRFLTTEPLRKPKDDGKFLAWSSLFIFKPTNSEPHPHHLLYWFGTHTPGHYPVALITPDPGTKQRGEPLCSRAH